MSSVGDNTQTIAEAPLTVEGSSSNRQLHVAGASPGKKVDTRSDIFSFGCVVRDGQRVRAFGGDNALSTLSRFCAMKRSR